MPSGVKESFSGNNGLLFSILMQVNHRAAPENPSDL